MKNGKQGHCTDGFFFTFSYILLNIVVFVSVFLTLSIPASLALCLSICIFVCLSICLYVCLFPSSSFCRRFFLLLYSFGRISHYIIWQNLYSDPIFIYLDLDPYLIFSHQKSISIIYMSVLFLLLFNLLSFHKSVCRIMLLNFIA